MRYVTGDVDNGSQWKEREAYYSIHYSIHYSVTRACLGCTGTMSNRGWIDGVIKAQTHGSDELNAVLLHESDAGMARCTTVHVSLTVTSLNRHRASRLL